MTQMLYTYGSDLSAAATMMLPVLLLCAVIRARSRGLLLACLEAACLGGTLAALAVVTWPLNAIERLEWNPFAGLATHYGQAMALANVLMLLPVGALAALWGLERRWALLIPLGIELGQYAAVQGRVCSTQDVLTGMLGVWAGWQAARFALAWSHLDRNRRVTVGPASPRQATDRP